MKTLSLNEFQIHYAFCDSSTNYLSIKEFCKSNDLALNEIEQTHSNVCVEACQEKNLKKADAHYTGKANNLLLLRTADCLPILCYSNNSPKVFAIHAGWRGLANGVILESIKHINVEDRLALNIIIGPHLQEQSFKSHIDVIDEINKITPITEGHHYKPQFNSKNKYLVNSQEIALTQLNSMGITSKQITLSKENTFTNKNFHSYRRDNQNAGRNLSWIYLS